MAQVLPLPFDVVLRVLEALTEDAPLGILYSCTLVDRQFNNAASKLLYKRVVLSPPFTRTINLKQRSQELVSIFLLRGNANVTRATLDWPVYIRMPSSQLEFCSGTCYQW